MHLNAKRALKSSVIYEGETGCGKTQNLLLFSKLINNDSRILINVKSHLLAIVEEFAKAILNLDTDTKTSKAAIYREICGDEEIAPHERPSLSSMTSALRNFLGTNTVENTVGPQSGAAAADGASQGDAVVSDEDAFVFMSRLESDHNEGLLKLQRLQSISKYSVAFEEERQPSIEELLQEIEETLTQFNEEGISSLLGISVWIYFAGT